MKRLYRSNKDRMLGGVCAGLGEHLDVDPTVIRLVWVILTAVSMGTGITCVYPGLDHHPGRRHRRCYSPVIRAWRNFLKKFSHSFWDGHEDPVCCLR